MRPTKALVRFLALFAALNIAACSSPSTAPTAAQTMASDLSYLNEVVNFLEANHYYRATIDWASIRAEVTAGVQAGKGRLESILLAIRLTKDNHSYYMFRNSSAIWTPFSTPECAANASLMTPFDWPADVGFVRVGAFSGSPASAVVFAEAIQSAIRENDRPGNVGWVVDLRHNTGGNFSPMVAGVGPVLGEGLAGYFVRGDGQMIPWGYEAGAVWQFTRASRDEMIATPYQLSAPARRVAVLTDSLTNSAGEATAIGFRGRPDTRTFGGQTCGRSSSPGGYKLSDGATLGIVNALDVDRLGTIYGGVLVPDETIRDDGDLYARVVQWLRTGM